VKHSIGAEYTSTDSPSPECFSAAEAERARNFAVAVSSPPAQTMVFFFLSAVPVLLSSLSR
jgi:hypothetical protein